MKKIVLILILAFAVFDTVMIGSCKKSSDKPATTAVNFDIPQGFPAVKFNFGSNPLTKEGIELGRHLFYDGRLSKDGNFPCASCHQQFAAFATYDHDLSHGFNNQFTKRNAPGLFNLAWQSNFMWDGGINNLEVQPLAPITAPNEMAEDINEVVNKTGITKTKAELAVETVFESMKNALGKGDRIELRGFGVFNVRPRKTGIGRNPRTGAEVSIPPGKAVRFKPGKELQSID